MLAIVYLDDGAGTKIFRTNDNANVSNLDHGVTCMYLLLFQVMYSSQSFVGWSQGNSTKIMVWSVKS